MVRLAPSTRRKTIPATDFPNLKTDNQRRSYGKRKRKHDGSVTGSTSSYANFFKTRGGTLSGPITLKGLTASSFCILDGYVAKELAQLLVKRPVAGLSPELVCQHSPS